MNIDAFKKKVEEEDFNWAEGEYNGVKGYFVKAEQRQVMTEKGMQPVCIFIPPKGIEAIKEWGHFVASCFPDLTYVTRIVGYYSTIHNWNPSKVRELEDRHKGDYKLNPTDK